MKDIIQVYKIKCWYLQYQELTREKENLLVESEGVHRICNDLQGLLHTALGSLNERMAEQVQ
jgi:hypothetical protein